MTERKQCPKIGHKGWVGKCFECVKELTTPLDAPSNEQKLDNIHRWLRGERQ